MLANALACSAALATLGIFESQNIIGENKVLAAKMAELSQRFLTHPNVAEVRQTGMILAIELVKNKTTREPYPWQERRGLQIHRYALSKGVLLRPLGNVIYFMPPYVITPGELTLMFEVAWEAMIHVTTH